MKCTTLLFLNGYQTMSRAVTTIKAISSGQALLLAVAKFAATDEQPAPENQGGGTGEDENPEQGLGF